MPVTELVEVRQKDCNGKPDPPAGGHAQKQFLTRYQHPNHQGSTTLETNEKGDIITYEEYHPFGTTSYQATNGSITAAAKRYRYTGMERDDETGLEYHNARYYISWLGRWINCDPIGIGDGVNVYAYCGNNPVGNVDPEGTQTYGEDYYIDKVKNSQQDNTRNQLTYINPVVTIKKAAKTAKTESPAPPPLAATGGGSANASPSGAKDYAQKSAHQTEMKKLNQAGNKAFGIVEKAPEESGSGGAGNSNLFFGIVGIMFSLIMGASGIGLPFVAASMIYSADMIGAGVTEKVTGKETMPIFQQLPTKFGSDVLGLDKDEARVFGAVVHAGIGFAVGGGGLANSSKNATFISKTLPNDEIISVIGGNKPGTFLLREIDHMPIGNITRPGKSGSIAQSFDIRQEVQLAFGRPAKKGDILLQSTVGDIRAAGFDVLKAPTNKNTFHVRIVSDSRIFDTEGTEWLNAAFQKMGKINK